MPDGEWDPPNDYVLDRALATIKAQAKSAADLLDALRMHFGEVLSLSADEAIAGVAGDLDAVINGERDDDFRRRLREEGGDYGMLSERDNVMAACYQVLATLTAPGTRGPVLSEAWKRKGNPPLARRG